MSEYIVVIESGWEVHQIGAEIETFEWHRRGPLREQSMHQYACTTYFMEEVMKLIKQAAILAALTGISAAAYAQTAVQPNEPVTRGEVRQDLRNVESEGYRPGDGDRTNYPANAQAAERRLSDQQGQGYGGVAAGSSSYGTVAQPMMQQRNDGTKGVYFGQ
jgi:hypothetical protein